MDEAVGDPATGLCEDSRGWAGLADGASGGGAERGHLFLEGLLDSILEGLVLGRLVLRVVVPAQAAANRLRRTGK